MQDSVTRHPDDNEEIGVLVGQTHVHLHASWLYQRHNQPEGRTIETPPLIPCWWWLWCHICPDRLAG